MILMILFFSFLGFAAEQCDQALTNDASKVARFNLVRLDESLYDSRGKPLVMNRPFIWEISDPSGVKTKAYLIGTFHKYIGLDHFPEWALNLIQSVDHVYLEHRISDVGPVLNRFLRVRDHDDPNSLYNQLSSDEKLRVARDFGEFAYAKYELGNLYSPSYRFELKFMTPFGFSMGISSNSEILTSEIRRKPISIDDKIASLAESSGARKRYLEKASDAWLLRLVESYSIQGVKEQLGRTQENIFVDAHQEIRSFLRAYHRGDESFFSSNIEFMGEAERAALLDQRNRAWLERISPILDGVGSNDRPVLFAVGVSHMFGAEGLLSHLEEEGFKVGRVKAD